MVPAACLASASRYVDAEARQAAVSDTVEEWG